MGWDSVNGDNVKGGGEGEWKEGKLRDFSKQFVPRLFLKMTTNELLWFIG